MKIASFFKIAISTAIISIPVNASVFVGGGVGIVDGAILEAGYKMNPFLSIRGRGTYLPSLNMSSLLANGFEASSGSFTNIDSLKIDSKTFDIGAEITPVPLIPIVSKIKLIGAIQYMDTNLTVGAGNYNAIISNKNAFAPYFGLGIDIINLPIISLRTTFGGSFRSFEVKSTNAPIVDKNALSSKIDGNMFIPSASITLRATLPNIPFIPFI
jgi:hypothetical protein